MKKREEGFSLIEAVIGLGVLSVVMLSSGFTVLAGIEQRRDASEYTLAYASLRDLAAEIQMTANLDINLGSQEGIASIYARYHNSIHQVPGLPGAQVTITCFPNEATVPVELGGPQDLNYDGDAADNLGNQSNGTDLKTVPLRAVATITVDGTTHTLGTIHRLITVTVD